MCFSLQRPPALAPISLQLPAVSTVAWNNHAPLQYMTLLPVSITPPLVQPYKNPVLPEETLSIYTDCPYQCPTIPIPSHHEEIPITEFGTKEMSSSTNTSGMPTHTTHSILSSTSNTFSTDNVRSGWELMKPLSNKPCIPIHKGGDRSLVTNYRPVSLTSVVCKQMEHVIASYLWQVWDKRDWLYEGQHGFRPGYSCESQVITVCQDIADSG